MDTEEVTYNGCIREAAASLRLGDVGRASEWRLLALVVLENGETTVRKEA